MKRLTAWVLSLAFAFSVCCFADAENLNERLITVNAIDLGRETGNLIVRNVNSQYYQLIHPDGEVLAGEDQGYTAMYFREGGRFVKVETASNDVHGTGLLDQNGNVLIPAEYADVKVISSRWQAGIRLTPCEADDQDYTFNNYSTGEKSFYRIDYADLFFDGRKVGSLSRAEYGDGSIQAYGAYISVTNTAREKHYYNSRLEKSEIKDTNGEYTTSQSRGKLIYIHNGSGQQAFVSSCTLNPDEVAQSCMYDDAHDAVIDLQGNQLFKTIQHYNSVRFHNEYAMVFLNRRMGVIDRKGNEVVPVEYDSVSGYGENFMAYGFTSAEKDGKFGIVDARGTVTCPFIYSYDIVSDYWTFASIKNLDGTVIVLTAGAGELQEHFADVDFGGLYGASCFVGKNGDGQYCVVDLYGNTVLPYVDAKGIDVNRDGTVALIRYGGGEYGIVQLEKAENGFNLGQDETWTCENGHAGNKGNFCPKCGAPKPAQAATVICPGCGIKFGDEIPIFCPECGTIIP